MPILIQASNFTGHILWMVTAFASAVLFCLVAWIGVQLHTHKRKEQRRNQIREEWNVILAGILMNESILEKGFDLPLSFTTQLKNPFVRSVLASELVRTRQSLRGNMAEAVVAVYNQLNLASCSRKLLNSRKWHLQAKGIQQLSIMEQHHYYNDIYIRINHPKAWVRNEAQLGMLRLRGTEGLGFLRNLRYPLTEWQQFNLLQQLQLQQSSNLPGLSTWLFSKNNSVAIFAIRLCRMYQMFDHANQIEKLQQHANASVRSVAGECMSHWGFAKEEPAVTFYHNFTQTQTA